jgi:hypothetical protein
MTAQKELINSVSRQASGENSSAALAYIAEAKKQGTCELEIDDEPNVSLSEGGAWVAAWVWIDNEAAGLKIGRQSRARKIRSKPSKSPARDGLHPQAAGEL